MPTIAEEWKQEGIEQGIEQGELIGRIGVMEEFLGRSVSLKESLLALSLDELRRISSELTALMRDRT